MKTTKLCLFVCLSLIAFVCLGCGSLKKTVNSQVAVSQVTSTKADSASVLSTQTKTFGDTLNTQDFVPAPMLAESVQDTTSYSDTESSHGIKFKETFTPQYKGKTFIGDKVNITAIAKPTQTTDTQLTKAASVSTTSVKDSTAKVLSTTKTTAGFSFGTWVLIGLGLLVVGCVVYFVFKPKI